jgi:hypothetical protein
LSELRFGIESEVYLDEKSERKQIGRPWQTFSLKLFRRVLTVCLVNEEAHVEHPAGAVNSPPAASETRHNLRDWLISIEVLAVLTLVMFADVLFNPKPVVLSHHDTDLSGQFIHWLTFGFGELKRGNLALWNPHVFSGAPFFGEFQSALLYPLNVIFLVLPVDRAINWSIALHVFLAGVFTYGWAARRGLRPWACVLAAVIFMFGGADFLQIYAGHLPHLCTLIWAPLLFLAIDGLFEQPGLGWTLAGIFAVAMQALAGFPQYFFYTGVAAAIYCVLRLLTAENRAQVAFGLAGMVMGGLALSAVQLLTGIQESHEMLRGGGLPYTFGSMFSFPPENFLMLLAPDFFGDMKTVPYWGRCYLWEMSLFVGVTGLVLAIVGGIWGERSARRFSVVMIVLMLLLALGGHTPLFEAVYRWVPGFNKFRGSSKFIMPASLFLAMLAANGFDELLKGRRLPHWWPWTVGVAGLLLSTAAVWVYHSSSPVLGGNWWHSMMLSVRGLGEIYQLPETYADPAVVFQRGCLASQSLLIAGATLMAVALLLWWARTSRLAVWVLLGLAVAELLVFARRSLDDFDPGAAVNPRIKEFLEAHPGDYRILSLQAPNAALSMGAQEIWGYDAGVALRYAQFVAFTQNIEPDKVTQNIPFKKLNPLLGMLRCRFVFVPQTNEITVSEFTNSLPWVLVVQRFRVMGRRDEIFGAMTNATFKPREEVILESPPDPLPAAGAEAGKAHVMDSSTDHLTIEAVLASPGILLITDTYARGWRARALPGSAQAAYKVMPANYCLRAVPLSAGKHVLRLEYVPSGFRVGKWISMISAGVFLVLVGLAWAGRTRRRVAS